MGPEDPESEAARRFLDDMDATARADEAAQPHSVIVYDPFTQSYKVTGPYPDGLTATMAAQRIKDELDAAAGAPGYSEIHTWIALHFPAED